MTCWRASGRKSLPPREDCHQRALALPSLQKAPLVPDVSNRRFQRRVWCQTCRIEAVKERFGGWPHEVLRWPLEQTAGNVRKARALPTGSRYRLGRAPVRGGAQDFRTTSEVESST